MTRDSALVVVVVDVVVEDQTSAEHDRTLPMSPPRIVDLPRLTSKTIMMKGIRKGDTRAE